MRHLELAAEQLLGSAFGQAFAVAIGAIGAIGEASVAAVCACGATVDAAAAEGIVTAAECAVEGNHEAPADAIAAPSVACGVAGVAFVEMDDS